MLRLGNNFWGCLRVDFIVWIRPFGGCGFSISIFFSIAHSLRKYFLASDLFFGPKIFDLILGPNVFIYLFLWAKNIWFNFGVKCIYFLGQKLFDLILGPNVFIYLFFGPKNIWLNFGAKCIYLFFKKYSKYFQAQICIRLYFLLRN